MELAQLTCANCSAPLQAPDASGFAHCPYCGSKVLLGEDGIIQERRDLERQIELCRVAFEAGNYLEAIKYCNQILEIDPKNVDAWIKKAVSTFWLTSAARDRYHESMQYLHEASQFAPDDQRIEAIRQDLAVREATWLFELANGQVKIAINILNASYWGSRDDAREPLIKAMDYYLLASDLAPNATSILEAIEAEVQNTGWIKYGDKVYAKLAILNSLRDKKQTEARLANLRRELEKSQRELANLKTQKGFLARRKTMDTERRLSQLKTEIAEMEGSELETEPKG